MFSCPFRSLPHNVRSELQRHRKGFKKLNLPADQRKALLRGLTTQVTFGFALTRVGGGRLGAFFFNTGWPAGGFVFRC